MCVRMRYTRFFSLSTWTHIYHCIIKFYVCRNTFKISLTIYLLCCAIYDFDYSAQFSYTSTAIYRFSVSFSRVCVFSFFNAFIFEVWPICRILFDLCIELRPIDCWLHYYYFVLFFFCMKMCVDFVCCVNRNSVGEENGMHVNVKENHNIAWIESCKTSQYGVTFNP